VRTFLPGTFQLFAERLARAFNLDPAPGGVMPGEVSGVVQPVASFSLDDHQFRYLSRIGSFGVVQFTPAAAGAKSLLQLTNPAGSGLVVRVKRLRISNTGGGALFYRWLCFTPGDIIPALANQAASTVFVRDTRLQNNLGATASARADCRCATTIGAPANSEAGQVVPVSGSLSEELEVTLAPGGIFWVFVDTANTATWFGVEWEERKVEPTELS